MPKPVSKLIKRLIIVCAVAAVLVLTGVAQLFHATKAPAGTGRIFSLALGVVVAGLGVMVWINPEIGSGFLLALLMMFFVVNGLWQLTTAWAFRAVRGWFWLLLCGLVSLVFVYLLWSQWPLAGAWVIGVFIGIDLLLTGEQDQEALRRRLNAMIDRVLQQWLQHQGRQRRLLRHRLQIPAHPQPLTQALALNSQIAARQLQFIPQR